jgi:hypothetical protein
MKIFTCNINKHIQETCIEGRQGIPLSGNRTSANLAHCTGYQEAGVGVSKRMFHPDKVEQSMLWPEKPSRISKYHWNSNQMKYTVGDLPHGEL